MLKMPSRRSKHCEAYIHFHWNDCSSSIHGEINSCRSQREEQCDQYLHKNHA